MHRRNLDTQGTGKRAFTVAQTIIQDAGHLLQPIDGDLDCGIDGYIRLRKKIKPYKIINKRKVPCEDYVDTGNLVGIQVKGVSAIPAKGSNSYYVNFADDTESFGVNFNSVEKLRNLREVWKNFIGPVILIFVDLETKDCWWADLNDDNSYGENGYIVKVNKNKKLSNASFGEIKKLGRELFVGQDLINIHAKNYTFLTLGITNFKESAKEKYRTLGDDDSLFYSPTINPVLGQIHYTRSGWLHITRLNRRKMRIINSFLLLGVSKAICEKVTRFTRVKKGIVRESERFIKKVDFLTLRAKVNFNYRQSAIVQVVLRRVKTFDKIHSTIIIPDRVFFHSVYEPYRKE